MPDIVDIPATVVAAMLEHAERDAPLEACGLLLGARRASVLVVRVVPTANAEASSTRYAIPAEQHFSVLRLARAEGLDVVGAYHSHPRGTPVPSPTDLAEAFPNFVFVIAGLAPGPQVRAWHLVDGNFAELSLVRT